MFPDFDEAVQGPARIAAVNIYLDEISKITKEICIMTADGFEGMLPQFAAAKQITTMPKAWLSLPETADNVQNNRHSIKAATQNLLKNNSPYYSGENNISRWIIGSGTLNESIEKGLPISSTIAAQLNSYLINAKKQIQENLTDTTRIIDIGTELSWYAIWKGLENINSHPELDALLKSCSFIALTIDPFTEGGNPTPLGEVLYVIQKYKLVSRLMKEKYPNVKEIIISSIGWPTKAEGAQDETIPNKNLANQSFQQMFLSLFSRILRRYLPEVKFYVEAFDTPWKSYTKDINGNANNYIHMAQGGVFSTDPINYSTVYQKKSAQLFNNLLPTGELGIVYNANNPVASEDADLKKIKSQSWIFLNYGTIAKSKIPVYEFNIVKGLFIDSSLDILTFKPDVTTTQIESLNIAPETKSVLQKALYYERFSKIRALDDKGTNIALPYSAKANGFSSLIPIALTTNDLDSSNIASFNSIKTTITDNTPNVTGVNIESGIAGAIIDESTKITNLANAIINLKQSSGNIMVGIEENITLDGNRNPVEEVNFNDSRLANLYNAVDYIGINIDAYKLTDDPIQAAIMLRDIFQSIKAKYDTKKVYISHLYGWPTTDPDETDPKKTKKATTRNQYVFYEYLHNIAKEYMPDSIIYADGAFDGPERSGIDKYRGIIGDDKLITSVDISYTAKDDINMEEAYPNPFTTDVKAKISVSDRTRNIKAIIVNSLGQPVKNIEIENITSLNYEIMWNGMDNNNNAVATGAYLLVISAEAGDGTICKSQKLILMK